MKEGTREELADFLRFCRSERRLAPLTCSAYERDVSACLDYLQGHGIEDLAEVKVTHLRAFLAGSRNGGRQSPVRRGRRRR
jgi:site-specific recombinase XerD